MSCWAFENLFDERTQPELGKIEADALFLPGAEGQQVFDQPVQLDAVVTQDGDHLALGVVQGSDRSVHEQFRALADVGERRLQFVRHVAQEAIAFLREIEQAQAQPFELRAEALQVARSGHFDGARERAAAELADGAVDGAQRPADGQRERQDGDQRERRQQRGLPEQPPLRARGLPLQFREARVDLRVAALGDRIGEVVEPVDAREDGGERRAVRAASSPRRCAISLCMAAKSSRLWRVGSSVEQLRELRCASPRGC